MSFFMALGFGVDPVGSIFHFKAFVDEQGRVATVIDDELRAETAGELKRLPRAPPIFFEALTLPGEHRNFAGGNRCGRVILSGENVAGNPAHFGTEIDERFDENRGLDGHVKRTHDAHALQRFFLTVFFPGGHEAGHFVLGDFNFLATKLGEADVSNFVICEAHISI
jgi:hypothetical protein